MTPLGVGLCFMDAIDVSATMRQCKDLLRKCRALLRKYRALLQCNSGVDLIDDYFGWHLFHCVWFRWERQGILQDMMRVWMHVCSAWVCVWTCVCVCSIYWETWCVCECMCAVRECVYVHATTTWDTLNYCRLYVFSHARDIQSWLFLKLSQRTRILLMGCTINTM